MELDVTSSAKNGINIRASPIPAETYASSEDHICFSEASAVRIKMMHKKKDHFPHKG